MRLVDQTLEDVAFLVCTAMANAGTTAVLSGGGAATVYAPHAYTSRDLDFILHFAMSAPNAQPVLDLGFSETKTRGIYAHPDISFTLGFLLGPLSVGDEFISDWNTLRRDSLLLHILKPLDCVKDRMAAAIHDKSFDASRQAAMVARTQRLNIDEVRNWCLKEGGATEFAVFERIFKG